MCKACTGILGTVQYPSPFLPHLAQHTSVLDKLTTKDCNKIFPAWNTKHKTAFQAIKDLVTSTGCLTTIDSSAQEWSRKNLAVIKNSAFWHALARYALFWY